VTLDQIENLRDANRAQIDAWWQTAMQGQAEIRPATPDEMKFYKALLRDQTRHELAQKILKDFGFSIYGTPLTDVDDDERDGRGLGRIKRKSRYRTDLCAGKVGELRRPKKTW
jgi:hypothetical protein